LQTHYDILGLTLNASSSEIKAAFRKLAKLYHPDKNPQGKEHFEKVLIAYEVLIDTNRRKQYDLKIKYATSAGNQTRTNTSSQKNKQWSFTEEELKRRQYYQENYKTHFQKNQAKANPPLKKNYNEYKYILFATPIAVALLLFILTIYDKDNSRVKPKDKALTERNQQSKLKMLDSPYASYFSYPIYDTVSQLSVLVNNLSPQEAIIVLSDSSGKFLRSTYIKPDYYVEVEQLPKTDITVRVMLGNKWDQMKEHKEAEVLGGFEKHFGYYQGVANKQNNWAITIDRKGILSFEEISEKDFFRKN
jgi:curved DNA-binding protein CbpA